MHDNAYALGENFHILVGGAFLFFSAILNRVAAVRRAALPRTIYVRTGLGAGSLNKRFSRMGTSRHCLPGYFLNNSSITFR